MNTLEKIQISNDNFSCEVVESIAVLTIKGNAFLSVASAARNLDIIPWFDRVEREDSIRGILILNEENSTSENAYVDFLKEIIGNNFDPGNPKEISKIVKRDIRAREINILSSLIRRLVRFKKIVINGIYGDIVSPFFGLALASDFRFISKDASFVLSHIKYRLHPSGALPFFLQLYLSQSKVCEILFRGTSLNSNELKKLGLVNGIFNHPEFKEKVLQESQEICKVSLNVVSSTKKLLYGYHKELDDYLNIESEFMMR